MTPHDEAAIQAGYRAAAAVFQVAYDTQAGDEGRSQAGLRWAQLLRGGSDAWQADLTADAAQKIARHVTFRLGLDVQPREITADELADAIRSGLETVL